MIKIRTYTLFDITRTNVRTRRHGETVHDASLIRQSNQQTNFETVLQIIGISSQPEDITDPEKEMKQLNSGMWGTDYDKKIRVPVWSFDFTVNYQEVFSIGNNSLGKLLQDCQGVPMITDLDEYSLIQNIMSVLSHDKNIHFEIIND